jgi:hypothetical protein
MAVRERLLHPNVLSESALQVIFLPGKAPCQDRGDSVITAENMNDLIGAFLTFQIGQINRDTLFEFHDNVYGEDPVLGEDVF